MSYEYIVTFLDQCFDLKTVQFHSSAARTILFSLIGTAVSVFVQ